jgi:hypothetical protein
LATPPYPPPAIAAVAESLRPLGAPWAVAGGWAIDLALGRLTRAHADVDVAVFRADQAALRETLRDWTFAAVVGRRLVPWPMGEWLAPPVHEVHARSAGGQAIELLLAEREGGEWIFRRDARVRRPVARVFRRSPAGVPLLAPEVVLLYKSKSPRAADEHDFAVGGRLLDDESRAWLRAALDLTAPGHPWATALGVGD